MVGEELMVYYLLHPVRIFYNYNWNNMLVFHMVRMTTESWKAGYLNVANQAGQAKYKIL